MGDRPTKVDLLRAVQRFLEEDLLPELEGVRRFHARVAANALGIVTREIETEGRHLPDRYARLCAILDSEPRGASDPTALAAEIETLEGRLCERIRAGDADAASAWREDLLEHLRLSVRERLAVSNPKHR